MAFILFALIAVQRAAILDDKSLNSGTPSEVESGGSSAYYSNQLGQKVIPVGYTRIIRRQCFFLMHYREGKVVMQSRVVQLLSKEASFESFEEAGSSDFSFQITYISWSSFQIPTSYAWGGANKLYDGGILKCFNN